MDEVVAARLAGDYVTNDPRKIILAQRAHVPVEWVTRSQAKRMAYIFDQKRWYELAHGPALTEIIERLAHSATGNNE